MGAPFPPAHSPSHPARSFPCAPWRTRTACCRWRVTERPIPALGFPRLPPGAPQVDLEPHALPSAGGGRSPCVAFTPHGRLDRLTSSARSGRGFLSVGRIRARCLAVRLPKPPVRTVLAAFIAHGSREKDVYRKCPFRQLHGVHRGQLARSLTTFVPFSRPSPSGPSPCM